MTIDFTRTSQTLAALKKIHKSGRGTRSHPSLKSERGASTASKASR